jgi:hypothetical protein
MENIQAKQILTDILNQFRQKKDLPEKNILSEDLGKLIREKFEIKEDWQANYKLEELLKILNDKYLDESDTNFKNQISQAVKYKIKIINGVSLKFRVIAFIVDLFVIAIIGSIIPQSILNANHGLYSLIFFLAYFALLNYFFNTTVGGKILKIKLLNVSGQKATFSQILFRELLFLTILTGIGFIIYLINGFYWDRATKLKLVFEKK